MTKRFTFFESYLRAIEDLSQDVQGKILFAIVKYGIDGKIVKFDDPVAKAIFEMAKPIIDNNRRRGAPCGNRNAAKNKYCTNIVQELNTNDEQTLYANCNNSLRNRNRNRNKDKDMDKENNLKEKSQSFRSLPLITTTSMMLDADGSDEEMTEETIKKLTKNNQRLNFENNQKQPKVEEEKETKKEKESSPLQPPYKEKEINKEKEDEEITLSSVKEITPSKPKTVARFFAPTIGEVKEYMEKYVAQKRAEGKYLFPSPDLAERFCNFYESKGWKVGSNAMKDWRAAARNWVSDTRSKQSSVNSTIHFEGEYDRSVYARDAELVKQLQKQ